MSGLVYQAINAVTADLATRGIPKSHRNEEGDYAYRGIEDVLRVLAPLIATHKLCVLPRVIEREMTRRGRGEQLVVLRVAFEFVSAVDGSRHVVESYGEAIDDSDKGTAKAMSAAYKGAMLQAFCIPVPHEDADATSPLLNGGSSTTTRTLAEPAEGWDSWSAEVIDIATSCESAEAIDRLLATRRPYLNALQRGRPALYAKVGETVADRLGTLNRNMPLPPRKAAAPEKAADPVDQRSTRSAAAKSTASRRQASAKSGGSNESAEAA